MKITVNDLIENLRGDMRSINYKNYTHSLRSVINTSVVKLLSTIKPISQIRTVRIENGVFGSETYFEAPSDMSEDSVISIMKCDKTECECCAIWDRVKDFDEKTPNKYKFDVEYNNGYKYIRLNPTTSECEPCKREINCLHAFNSKNENGHWNVYDGIIKMDTDYGASIVGDSSLSFSMRTDGYIKNVNSSPIPVLTTEQIYTLWVHINKPQRLKDIKIILEEDSENYAEFIATSRHNGPTFVSGWNLVKFKFVGKTGTPSNQTKLTVKFGLINGANDPCNPKSPCEADCDPVIIKLNCLSIRDTECYKIKYYSNYVFRNNITGNHVDKITDVAKQGDYEINLDEEAYIIFYEILHRRLKYQNMDEGAANDLSFVTGELATFIKKYNVDHPSYVRKPIIKKGGFYNEARAYGW